MDRIIAQGSVASKPAGPVPIAPGRVRLFAQMRTPELLLAVVRQF
jgi:hypothetical protein